MTKHKTASLYFYPAAIFCHLFFHFLRDSIF